MASSPKILHHLAVPSSQSSTYQPGTTLDFLVEAAGRKMINGSLRISGSVNFTASDGGAIVSTDEIHISKAIGAHTFFSQLSVECQSQGVLENLQEYPRYMTQVTAASRSRDDSNTIVNNAELRAGGFEANGKYVTQQVASRSTTGVAGSAILPPTDQSFCIKPMLCFNRAAGNSYSFDRNGWIRVSTILSSNLEACFGTALDPTKIGGKYSLSDLEVTWSSEPEDGITTPQLMRSYVNTTSSMQSTATSITSRVPSRQVNGVSVSFYKQSDQLTGAVDSLELQSLPLFSNVEYLFNNATNQSVSYVLRDLHEAIEMGVKALSSSGHTTVSNQTLSGNNGTLLGLPFSAFTDLSSMPFSMRLTVDDPGITTEALAVYSYFSTLISL